MQKLLRGFFVFLLLLLGVGIAAAQEPSLSDFSSRDGFHQEQAQSDEADLRVIPDDGQVGDDFTILVSELNANEEVSIRIIFVETDAEVYETSRTADERGRLELDIFTENSDSAGTYRVEVVNSDGDVIAESEFVLEAVGGREGLISVSPSEGAVGTSFVIEITEVQPFADLLILVTNEAGDEVFSTAIRATVDGTATVNFPSSDTAVGNLSIQVLQNEEIPVASGSLVVQAEEFPATIVLEPNPAMPNDEVFVTISGLEADAAVTVVVSAEGETVVTQEVTANVSGLAIFSFVATPEIALGDYTVEVLQGETVLARSSWTVDIPALTVTISPEVGVPSSNFLVEVTTLRAGEEVVVELLQGESVLQTFTITGDAEGYARAVLGQRLQLTEGDYSVRVLRAGQEAFNQTVSIIPEREAPETTGINPADVSISVSPESGTIPTTYEIRVEGVPADTDLTLVILFDGQAIFTTQETADAEGILLTAVTSEATDPVGTYTLEVRADGQVLGSVDFAILDEEAQATEEPEVEATEEPEAEGTETPAGDVVVSIEPATVPQGERFEIFVNNLAAGETVTVELRLNGEAVYTSEATADTAGALALGLRAESDDETGEYEVVVLRDGEEIVTGSFSIVASSASVNRAEVSISPESAPQGSSHTINVTGLEAGETVTVDVTFNGEEVYSTERAADSEGAVTIVLSTSAEDEPGQYNVTVTHENGGLIGSFNVTEGEESGESGNEEAETPGDLTISINPESGEIGTVHEISVSGLEAEEAVTVTVEFDGEVVYETSGTADENGVYLLSLATEEGDAAGEYTVSISSENGDEISATFLAEGDTAENQEESDFSLSVEPDEVSTGENFDVSVSGLDAGETVAIVIFFDGEIVYQTSRDADDNGEIVLALALEANDPSGTYTVEVQRNNGDEVATAEFEAVTESGAGNEEGEEQEGGAGSEEEQEGEEGEEIESGGEIALGDETYTGRLTEDEPEARFTFEAEEGQGVQIDASSEQFDTYLILLNANGEEVAYDDDSAGNLNSRIITVLPESGEYTIVVTSFGHVIDGEAGVGRFNLSAQAVEIEDPNVELGAGNHFVTENLDATRPQVNFIIEAQEGDTLLISAESTVFDTYMMLMDEDGEILASNDDSNGTLNSQIGPFEVPADGEYTVAVTSYYYINYGEATVGEFTLRVESVEVTETAYGEAVEFELNEDSGSRFIEFEGSAGDVISVSVNSNESIDTTLSLLDPTGYSLVNDDDGGLGYDPEIERFVLPSDGTYVIAIRAFTLGDSGEVEVLVDLEDERSIDEEARLVRLNTKQNYDILVFEGVAGEVVDVVLTLEGGTVGSFSVYASQADSSLLNYQSYGMRDSITLSFLVPADGIVQIVVQDNSGSNVILNVELVRE